MAMNNSNISNIPSNDSSEIGGSVFFLTYISEYLPYVTLVSIGSVMGVIGNLIIMLTIIFNRELHSPTYMLMFNLSISDILVSGFVDSTSIWSVFIGKTYFVNRPSLCIFIGLVCGVGCNSSLVNLGFIAVNRYLSICHNSLYKKLFTTKLTLLYCLLAFILGFLNNLPNLTGWGNYVYDSDALICAWNRRASLSYNLFLIIFSIIIPCIAIFLFYVRIFYYSYKSGHKSNSSSANKSVRLAKGLFASFMLYSLCWMPYGLFVLINFYDQFPRSVMMYTMTLGHLNSSLNPIIYFIFNSAFRHGSVNLFNKVFCFVPFCRFTSNRISITGNHSSGNSLAKTQTKALYKT